MSQARAAAPARRRPRRPEARERARAAPRATRTGSPSGWIALAALRRVERAARPLARRRSPRGRRPCPSGSPRAAPRRSASIAARDVAHAGRRPSTTRSRPARSRVTTTSVEARAPRGARRRHPRAARAPRARGPRRASTRPPPPAQGLRRARRSKSATCGSQSTTSGASPGLLRRGRTADWRRRDPSPPGQAGEACRAGGSSTAIPVLAAFSRASESASSETSMPVTRAPGCSSAIASAIAPEPVPTSRTRGASTPREEGEAPLDDGLGLRTRDQRTPVDGQRRGAGSPIHRRCTGAARGPPGARRAPRRRSSSVGVRTRPRSTTRSTRDEPEDVRHEAARRRAGR